VERGPIACVELADWHEHYGLVAGVSLRGWDLGLASLESTQRVLQHWWTFQRQFQPHFTATVTARQCHGTNLALHDAATSGWHLLDERDGHVTRRAGLLLTATVADCVPVYLAVPGSGWLGLVHAGWRGIASGIVEGGLQRLVDLSGCAVSDIIMHCGVSICGSCYEVGPEVASAVSGRRVEGAEQLDLRAAAARRAMDLGVRRVTCSPWCTAHDESRFYSHRRSHGSDGRMVAYLGRPLA
jgi:YfiH family protein